MAQRRVEPRGCRGCRDDRRCGWSIALEGFGLDSTIEVFSALVVVWRLRPTNPKNPENSRPCA